MQNLSAAKPPLRSCSAGFCAPAPRPAPPPTRELTTARARSSRSQKPPRRGDSLRGGPRALMCIPESRKKRDRGPPGRGGSRKSTDMGAPTRRGFPSRTRCTITCRLRMPAATTRYRLLHCLGGGSAGGRGSIVVCAQEDCQAFNERLWVARRRQRLLHPHRGCLNANSLTARRCGLGSAVRKWCGPCLGGRGGDCAAQAFRKPPVSLTQALRKPCTRCCKHLAQRLPGTPSPVFMIPVIVIANHTERGWLASVYDGRDLLISALPYDRDALSTILPSVQWIGS